MLIPIIFALSLFVGYSFFARVFRYWQKRGVPGPPALPQMAKSFKMMMRMRSEAYEFDEVYRNFKGKYRFIGIYEFFTPRIFLLDPALIRDIMSKEFESWRENGYGDMVTKDSDPFFGRNPFFLKDDEWKVKRDEIQPGFSNARIKALFPHFEKANNLLVEYLKKEISKGESIDVKEIGVKYTTETVGSAVFGTESGAFTKETSKIREMRERMMIPSPGTIVKMMLSYVMPFLSKYRKLSFVSEEVQEYFIELMKKTIKDRNAKKDDRQDYLDHLIQLQKKKMVTEMDITAHGATFLINGFETSAVTIAYALFELSRNSRVQNKLRAEINEAISKQPDHFTFDVLSELPYLDQVLAEVLRLHPPVLTIQRICSVNTELECSNGRKVTIEKGTCASIPIWSVQRDERFFHEPNEFKPERFNEELGGLKDAYEKGLFLAFGLGPRICLGERFAVLQVKASIAAIVRHFELSLSAKMKIPIVLDPNQYINMPIGGTWVDFKEI